MSIAAGAGWLALLTVRSGSLGDALHARGWWVPLAVGALALLQSFDRGAPASGGDDADSVDGNGRAAAFTGPGRSASLCGPRRRPEES